MGQLYLSLIYIMFFLSGAAALIYEVVWVRSLSLIFGGTHLAVTTVLAVFMGGLALGSYTIGKRVDALKKPLQFYGLLELGIGLFAIVFLGLMKIYPTVYVFFALGGEASKLYLTGIRVIFAVFALIVPTTLMGGTLPVLTRFVSGHPRKLGRKLALLYSFNTLGAVVGTAAAAFFLLRFYSVSVTFYTAITINLVIGLLSILLQDKVAAILASWEAQTGQEAPKSPPEPESIAPSGEIKNLFSAKLVLFGIGVSGFCALGYEVLWTRILTLTIGTSVYGFSIMLVAFLTGIALGSKAYALLKRFSPAQKDDANYLILWFGIVQCLIGVTALLVTVHIRDLPVHAIHFRDFFLNRGMGIFHARQWGNLTLAFSYMLVPAFFMGLAFPIAGKVNISYQKRVGHAVGGVLTYNTIGAILGSAVSGFLLIYVFGIERSLELLTFINFGFGLLVVLSLLNSQVLNWGTIGVTVAALCFLALSPDSFRVWDQKFFAIYQNNQEETYSTPYRRKEAIKNTDVLFYHEGENSTVSVIKVKGGMQGLLVNGKVVASAALRDQQCQYTLGHLPMLLHKDPRQVLVVGLGTGMTLGSTLVHPSVEQVTLAEIEPNVVGAARTFAKYNNNALDNPKLKIVFNDGRNYLLTTKNKYDVITADPIHPWTQGSGYLYTAEYFKLASEHLLPGGIMCQWLPIYELNADDLKSVVRTFSQNFKYTMTWLTYYDAEIIGSNSPILIDEKDLARRIAFPAIQKNLRPVMMGTATDFLSYFIMGTDAMKEFGQGAIVNTDDNLYLEYSTPVSLDKNLMGLNVASLGRYRESILPYLVPDKDEAARQEQIQVWNTIDKAARIADHAHALILGDYQNSPTFEALMTELEEDYDWFSPTRFIHYELGQINLRIPTLLDQLPLAFVDTRGRKVMIKISAVIAPVSEKRAKLAFVDNAARKIFGQKYFSGPDHEKQMEQFTKDVFENIQAAYNAEAEIASRQNKELPSLSATMPQVKKIIQDKCRKNSELKKKNNK